MSELPEAPENVRLILRDGTELACEVYDDGLDDDGQRTWVVTADAPPLEQIFAITCDMLPPQTRLVFPIRADEPVIRCTVCDHPIPPGDPHAGYGLCASCLHDARRSGWDPSDLDGR